MTCHKRDMSKPPPSALCAHLCRSWHMRLMVPLCNLQPGSYTPFWCPPTECEGVTYWWQEPPLKLVMQLKGGPLVPKLICPQQELRLWVLPQAPEGPVWKQWRLGSGSIFWMEVGHGTWRTEWWLPSGAHKNPLPPILPQLPQHFPTPWLHLLHLFPQFPCPLQ